jgi:hypothetical protein
VRNFFDRNLSALSFFDFGSSVNSLALVSGSFVRQKKKKKKKIHSSGRGGQIIQLSIPALWYSWFVCHLDILIGLSYRHLSAE